MRSDGLRVSDHLTLRHDGTKIAQVLILQNLEIFSFEIMLPKSVMDSFVHDLHYILILRNKTVIAAFNLNLSMSLEQNELNQSKFLTEQINADEEPTEEEIIQRAEELGIDDFALAKESLVKELDPQWKPYINRFGEVYYINLEDRKAYADHPIDMQAKITYALNKKKKIPVFQEYRIEDISRSLKLVQAQIKEYERTQALKIVYEESEEESVRKDTKLSEEDDFLEEINEQIQLEVKNFKRQAQKAIQNEIEDYRKKKEKQYERKLQNYQDFVQQMQKKRLETIADTIQKQIISKNKIGYLKAIEVTKEQLDSKKQRYDDLLDKELNLMREMHSSSKTVEEIRFIAKEKMINHKRQIKAQLSIDLNLSYRGRLQHQLKLSNQIFERETLRIVASKINYRECFQYNIQQLSRKDTLQPKKRYSIFNSQVFQNKRYEENQQQIHKNNLIIDEDVWAIDQPHTYIPYKKSSLSLRLMKRIL